MDRVTKLRQVEVNQKTKVGLKERFTGNIEIEKVGKEEKGMGEDGEDKIGVLNSPLTFTFFF